MRRGPGGVCGGSSGRSRLRGVRLGGGCGRSWGVPPGHRVRGLLRSVGLRPWGVRPALCGARALSPPRGRVGGSPPRALPSGGLSVLLPGGVLVRWWLRLLGVCGVRSGARAPGCALGSGGAVVRLCGSARWWVVGAPDEWSVIVKLDKVREKYYYGTTEGGETPTKKGRVAGTW